MPSTIKITKEILMLIEPRLSKFGLFQVSASYYTLPMADESIGTLGLNVANFPEDSLITINPVIGVRSQRIEKLVSELKEIEFNSFGPPTISSPVGYLMPQKSYKTWTFRSEEKLARKEGTASEMASAIETYGIPYMRQYCSLDQVHEYMVSQSPNELTLYRLPVAMFLLGRPIEAEKFVRGTLRDIASRTDKAADFYRKFADNFLALLVK